MGVVRKTSYQFLEDIPRSKLEGGIASDTIYSDGNYRLDNQGTTTAKYGKPKMINLQMQVNRNPDKTSLAGLSPKTVSQALVPMDGSWTAEQIIDALKARLEVFLLLNGW